VNKFFKTNWIPIVIFSLTVVWLIGIQYVTMTTPVKNYRMLQQIQFELDRRAKVLDDINQRFIEVDASRKARDERISRIEVELKRHNDMIEVKK
jgi:hypothetical protein